MNMFLGFIMGIVTMCIAYKICHIAENNKLLEKYHDERQQNRELRNILEELRDILIYADKTKENFFITLNKIKSILFNDYQSGK